MALNEDISSQKKALEEISVLLASGTAMDQDEILSALIVREKLGSTGLGNGIAIPHCRMGDCQKAKTALLTLKKGINYEARDNRDVDILWALVVPEESTDEHLDILAKMAEQLDKQEFRSLLRNSRDAKKLHEALVTSRLLQAG